MLEFTSLMIQLEKGMKHFLSHCLLQAQMLHLVMLLLSSSLTAMLTITVATIAEAIIFFICLNIFTVSIEINPGTYTVREDSQNAVLRLVRGRNQNRQCEISVATIPVSANGMFCLVIVSQNYNSMHYAESDITSTVLTVMFEPGQLEAIVRIPIVDDPIAEEIEIFAVVLSTNASDVVFSDDVATVTIIDNDGIYIIF